MGMEYWKWMKYWFDERMLEWDKIRPVDCLVAEISTPKLMNYGWMNNKIDYKDAFDEMDMEEFFKYMIADIPYNVNYVNNHINYWSFEKMQSLLLGAGFSMVVRSKYGGAYCFDMQDRSHFDRTHPEMSLYVDAIK